MRKQYLGMALCLSCLPISVWSAPSIETTDHWSLEKYSDTVLNQFVITAVESNPRVLARRAALEASRSREFAAGQSLYNPELEADYENAVDTTWEVGIGQTLDWSGKRKARQQTAEYERSAAEAELTLIRQSLAVDLLSALSLHQIEQRRYKLASEREQAMSDFAGLAQRRLDAGDLNQVEADLAALASIEATNQRATSAANLAEAKQAVRNIISLEQTDQWPSVDFGLPEPLSVKSPLEWVVNLPEVQAARRRVDAADAQVELRELERRPDPTVSLRGGREDDSTLVGVNLSIPLYIRNSHKYEASAARAERDLAQQVFDDEVRRAAARLVSATERYELSRNTWEGWEKTGRHSLDRQGALLERLWEAGDLNTTDYLVQLRQSLDTRESALDLQLTLWLAWFEWLAASGQVDNWLGLGGKT